MMSQDAITIREKVKMSDQNLPAMSLKIICTIQDGDTGIEDGIDSSPLPRAHVT